MTRADRIVQHIVRDLRSRKGLRQVWDDEIDAKTKREIMREWRKIVEPAFATEEQNP